MAPCKGEVTSSQSTIVFKIAFSVFHVRWCVKFRIGYFSGTLHFLSFQLQQQSVEGHFMSLKLTDGSTDCQSVGLTLTCSVPFGSNTALYCIYVHMLALFHCYIYIYIYKTQKHMRMVGIS